MEFILTLTVLNICLGINKKKYIYSVISLPWGIPGCWYNSVWNQDQFSQYVQYHGCWWPGDAKRRGISSNGSDQVIQEYSSSNTKGSEYIGNALKIQISPLKVSMKTVFLPQLKACQLYAPAGTWKYLWYFSEFAGPKIMHPLPEHKQGK